MKFRVGDRVEYGDVVGEVICVRPLISFPITVKFYGGFKAVFNKEGKFFRNQPKGFPRLELVERKKEYKRKVMYQRLFDDIADDDYCAGTVLYSSLEKCLTTKMESFRGYKEVEVFIEE